jgi:beta-barrel assembly-enhancing protease
MKKGREGLLVIFFLFLAGIGHAQVNFFENYRPLEAVGAMPQDFFKLTFEKVNEESASAIPGLSKKASQDFLKGIHYGIDEILRSGKVLYGDTLTAYVQKVGNLLIMDNPELANIRFYTIKTNVINAFSTKQGIIFVTQGLVAQLSNESQLAFVLAHEIAHYLRDHIIDGYRDNLGLSKSRVSYEDKIKQYSTYSKDREFEADRLGLELYHKAGYSRHTVLEVFDVLTYSYLPFDLKDIPIDFLNDGVLFLPERYFAKEFPKISAEEDYDDAKSTHPNIDSRREEINRLSGELVNWGNAEFHLSKTEFFFARNVARFESVRNDLYNFRYTDALYSIFLLEADFPNNLQLAKWKAQAWAGILTFRLAGRMQVVSTAPHRVQGPSHQLHHLMRQLNKKQLTTVAFRQVALMQRQFQEDDELKAIYRYALNQFVKDELFNLKEFDTLGYHDAKALFEEPVREAIHDSLQDPSGESKKELNKYERIRLEKKSKVADSNTPTNEFKEEDFFRYALADIIETKFFLESVEEARAKLDLDTKRTEQFDRLSYREKRKKNRLDYDQRLMLGLKDVILLEPRAIKLKKNRIVPEKSEELELQLREISGRLKSIDEMTVHNIGTFEFKEHGTQMYNHKAHLLNAFAHLMDFDDMQLFPVDYLELQEISGQYGTSKVCFVFVQSVNIPPYIPGVVSASVFAPVWIVLAPFAIMTSYITRFNVVVYDIQDYNFVGYLFYDIHGITNKTMMEVLIYDVLNQIGHQRVVN